MDNSVNMEDMFFFFFGTGCVFTKTIWLDETALF